VNRPLLLVGGAPRLVVDAVRFLSVRASGATAVALAGRLQAAGLSADLLLGVLAEPAAHALRYDSREDLELALRRWIAAHPDGVVVMSAAINDYQVQQVESRQGEAVRVFAPGDKAPSGADELVIRLRPASKVIDRLRPWGLHGPIVGFKFEDAATVVASAQALRRRTGAALVVANSLCGQVQALVGTATVDYAGREALLEALGIELIALAQG
jgi:phosphopantothenoylcysteine synthetase/decarboxylase